LGVCGRWKSWEASQRRMEIQKRIDSQLGEKITLGIKALPRQSFSSAYRGLQRKLDSPIDFKILPGKGYSWGK
jgi:hypothetical protein